MSVLKTEGGSIWLRWLYGYPVWAIGFLFLCAMIIVFWNVYSVSRALTDDAALRYAEQYLESIDTTRSVYSNEVVKRAKEAGVVVSADYRMHDDQIPFPATFSLFLAREINAGHSGIKTNLYSDYPWPWRADGGARDTFEKQALEALTNKAQTTFVAFENEDGVRYLRYGRAVIMKESCVNCHNSHPQSTKTDWKIGDVRGVQAISISLPSEMSMLQKYLSSTAIIMVIAASVLLALLGLVVRELRRSLRKTKRYADETEAANLALTRTNATFSRFVPHEFLAFLRREKIIDVQLGDNAQKEMTILFSDIRNFTTISEKLSPEDNFQFINNYLTTMGPVVREHGGFIDKYIGDAIMALFDSADAALEASIAMLRSLDGFNQREADNGHFGSIRIGIGLNTGHIMLGTIGEANRMEGTVISDSVNLASRIEGLTKDYQTPLLISDKTLRRLKNRAAFSIRLIGCSRVKGKKELVTLYEVFDADPDPLKLAKQATAATFTEAVKHYLKGNHTEALAMFTQCADKAPQDLAAQQYLRLCQQKVTS